MALCIPGWRRVCKAYLIALDVVQRIDAFVDVECAINGTDSAQRLTVRRELSTPLMADLHTWLSTQIAMPPAATPEPGRRLLLRH